MYVPLVAFSSHLNYACQVWGQNISDTSKTFILQKEAIRIITFSDFNAHSSPLFKELQVLKLPDIIKLQNCILVHNVLNCKTPLHLRTMFIESKTKHNHYTINSSIGSVELSAINTEWVTILYIYFQCSLQWNRIIKELKTTKNKKDDSNNKNENKKENSKGNWIRNLSTTKLKNQLTKHFLGSY